MLLERTERWDLLELKAMMLSSRSPEKDTADFPEISELLVTTATKERMGPKELPDPPDLPGLKDSL